MHAPPAAKVTRSGCSPLPTAGQTYLSEAGLETELVFGDGIDLPLFSAAVLLERQGGRERLQRYYAGFVALAEELGAGALLETPTWRLSRGWAERLGFDRPARRRMNREAVRLLVDLRDASSLAGRFVVSGNLGPRYDGYRVDQRMHADDAAAYHSEQIADLVQAGADAIGAMTITTSDEAVGIAHAAAAMGAALVVSFTVETDGRLPSGEPLGEAIARVDAEVPGAVTYFGINCAHPTHFMTTVREGGAWRGRIGALRANASKRSHAELDASVTLDAGDPDQLAREYATLMGLLPGLRVLGGCCGTDARHVARIVSTCMAARSTPLCG